jgi:hypothetical protein
MYPTLDRITVLGKPNALLAAHESENTDSPNRQGSKFAWHYSEHIVLIIKHKK